MDGWTNEVGSQMVDYRLIEHATNKHSKTLKDCFPSFEEAAK
jgi:hypothetical protein